MFEINVNKEMFVRFARTLPERHRRAMVSAMRSEAYRLLKRVRKFARSWGEGAWPKPSPLALFLRRQKRGKGFGKWLARFARYHVFEDRLEARIGVLGKSMVGEGARFKPISEGFARTAKKLVSGYTMTVTPEYQRAVAKLISKKRRSRKARGAAAKFRKFRGAQLMPPRLGPHKVPPRPFAEPIMRKERARSIRNIQRLYKMKLERQRWGRNWAEEWGNA